MKSSYQLKNITTRQMVLMLVMCIPFLMDLKQGRRRLSLGYYREDYEFVNHNEPDYLDEHNGRWCITPEYPNGTYAYFCTVDEN